MILCGKNAGRMLYAVNEYKNDHPEEAASIFSFLIYLIPVAIGSAIISLILTMIVKSVFELNKDDAQGLFILIGIILLVIGAIAYFV